MIGPEADRTNAPYVELRHVTKHFPGVLAVSDVSLTVEPGEIHALLGENGAGKTTLMNVLYGLLRRDSGEILIDGAPVDIQEPRDAIDAGIGMVHQEYLLIPRFTVVENLILGARQDAARRLLDLQSASRRIRELSESHGLAVDPSAAVEHLTIGEQQRVEIVKLLYRRSRLLILDEPTSVLTPQEIEGLFLVLRSLAAEGHSIIFITHKLREVIEVAHKVTVLRDGRVVDSRKTSEIDERELGRMVVGRDIQVLAATRQSSVGGPLLTIEALSVDDRSGGHKVQDVSLEVHSGEIVGLAGVDGNGQSELAEALMGLLPARRGRILLEGTDMTRTSCASRRSAGLAYVPADRRGVGSIGPLSLAMNALLGSHRRHTRARGLFVDHRKGKERAQTLIRENDVRAPNTSFPTGALSGGNLQKLIFGREMLDSPRVLIADQPTRGLDVAATEYVRRLLLAERDKGVAILLISAELDEILALSDRVAVISAGKLMGVVRPKEVEVETLGLMMAGTPRSEAEASSGTRI
jgi:general nucleoside transport system ATP-binding protein